VARFTEIYSRMRKGIIAHDLLIDESNVALLDGLHFVFISIDVGPAKRVVVDHLVAKGTPFIDLGMGVTLDDGQLAGIVRTTLSTPGTRELAAPHISYADGDGGANEYATNIQIAELNALNAAMAVMAWKRYFGFYRDTRRAVYSGYSIASGEVVIEGARMTHISRLQPRFIDLIPERLEPGILYISRRYSTASHLCCCGCGLEVVTPLNPAKWRLTEDAEAVSLWPSIGNWTFPCQSHYWIARNQVHWAESMSAEIIATMKARDRRDVERLAPPPLSLCGRLRQVLRAKWDRARALFLSWWHQ
jgi:hypothetical protein